jgi:intermediate peptidase
LQLGRKFLQNVSEPREGVALSWGEVEEGMGEGFARRIWAGVGQTTGKGKVDPSSHDGRVMARHHPSGDVRRKMFVGANAAPESHVETLEELLRTRAKLATLVGRQSWGNVALDDKMAGTPTNVMGFLDALNQHNLPLANKDLTLLKATKKAHLKTYTTPKIEPWDRDFYSDLSSSSSNIPDISPFLSLGTCFLGLSNLFTSLYGISFQVDPIAPGETWESGVRKLRVMDEDEGRIGTIYCDLFAREGKQPGAAHYTVRCSRRIDDDDVAGDFDRDGRAEVDGVSVSRGELEQGGLSVEGVKYSGRKGVHQEPIVALVCAFAKAGGKDGMAFLQWHEVETLFHEMGHAIHCESSSTIVSTILTITLQP